MTISANGASNAANKTKLPHIHNQVNPAKQAKLAEPKPEGKDFGAMVAAFAKAK